VVLQALCLTLKLLEGRPGFVRNSSKNVTPQRGLPGRMVLSGTGGYPQLFNLKLPGKLLMYRHSELRRSCSLPL
jgi:hypothetical protein